MVNRRWLLACLVVRWGLLGFGPETRAEPPAGFTPPPIEVPAGFRVEPVAAPPLVEHPVYAGFDERGRLFVADNAGHNLRNDLLLEHLPNRIVCLEDTNGDGRFDRSTVFADRMTFPMGALWYRGSLYVASPPFIWRLTDTNGDGRADRRETIVGTFGFNGNAADIHGCFLGPNGRIYWTDGRHGHEFQGPDGKPYSKGLAARVFSCLPDGSQPEVFCGGGMDNPVEIAFTAEGEMLGTMTYYNPDDIRYDALVHFVWGGVYPRHHPCLAEFRRTGPPLPAVSLFQVVAPSGLMRVGGDHLGEDYRDSLFSAHFNTHRIVRHQLRRQGATFQSQDSDFLVSSSIDFHPTDVLEDADGSLLVVDTGGWFRIGCPTSQIAKPEIRGAIYRVWREGGPRPTDPRGLKLAWDDASADELTRRLADDRPAVVDRAIDALARRGDAAVEALAVVVRRAPSAAARRNAVWALSRLGSAAARALLREALGDADWRVRLAAVRSVGTLRHAGALSMVVKLLSDESPPVQREAATALGRIGDPQAVGPLLAALADADDRFVEHALIYALIELNNPAATRTGLADGHPAVRRGALVALDQMLAQSLTAEVVVPLADTDDPRLQQTVLEIVGQHADWGPVLGSRLGQWLAEPASPQRLAALRGALVGLQAQETVARQMGEALGRASTPQPTRLLLLEVMAQADLPTLPQAWQGPLRAALEGDDAALAQQACATVAALRATAFNHSLRQLAANPSKPLPLRLAAIGALAQQHLPLEEPWFELLVEQLDPAAPPADRLLAARAIGRAALNPAQQRRLPAILRQAGALELPALLGAVPRDADEVLAGQLVEALHKSPGRAALVPQQVRDAFAASPQTVQQKVAQLLAEADAGSDQQRQRLAALEVQLSGGDAKRGRQVFFDRRAACATCHRVGGQGGRMGPDLSTIGQRRSRRDLLEAIVYPSLSFARGYESYTVSTDSGQVHTGLIVRETADALYLRTVQQEDLRIARREIEQMLPSRQSIMPTGLEQMLSPQQLADLIGFLESLK